MLKQLGHPVLRQVAEEVQDINGTVVSTVNRMKFCMTSYKGYGVAAPQIGISKQIFVWKSDNGVQALINPKIMEYSKNMWLFDEGCLSIPSFSFSIWRPEAVTVSGLLLSGKEITLQAHGLNARILEHELDHLAGILIIDLLEPLEKEKFIQKWHRAKKRK